MFTQWRQLNKIYLRISIEANANMFPTEDPDNVIYRGYRIGILLS